ncbi:alpha-galactosidase [Kitasatospora sp. NBC_01287]|uniref:glycoside hydrolase family 36 protein n=1 Tax=Kitasatospora sp. NBC_01287 TaxID=2903573 RepID=UPI002256CC64|nr:glycoside hydrolase family 36 protein [Kitasatospora sp. NBC_01287]MCX4750195.1 alpha-galactosidase [Kitasatospora sp. NBC_01287]
MSPLSWDGTAPPSGRGEYSREIATGIPGLRLRVTAVGARALEVRTVIGDRSLTLEAAPLDLDPPGGGPARVRVEWQLPCAGATALWTPATGTRWLPPSWSAPRTAALPAGAPIGSLIGAGDAALCTFAVAERVLPVAIGEGAVEESGEFTWWVEHQVEGEPLRLRLDLTGRHFAETLAGMVSWWGADELPAVPDGAFEPVFCTWYARHLEITAAETERLAALAAPLGFGALIVDDGWQTEETTRSYATTGDWQPAAGPFPDFAAHVARVRALGLAYLLWHALPFAGDRSAAGQRFAGRRLAHLAELETSVLDPADPEVRDHLVERLAAAVEQHGVDGLKIDFIDTFSRHAADQVAVAEGVRLLLAELDARLRAARPGLLVEHRQPYIGPGLWPYATMVRATDCPHNAAENRARTTDLRLTAGPLAVHADPLTWHPDEHPVEIAVQLQSVLFATAQVSVDLGAQGPEQLAALRFWLAVMREHVGLLQRGTFRPHRPELGYPLLESRRGGQLAVGRYAPVPVAVTGAWELLLVANADPDPLVRLVFERPPGRLDLLVRDCAGVAVTQATITAQECELAVPVPRGGLLTLAPSRTVGRG